MDPQELAAQLGYPPPDQVGDGFNTGTGVGVPDHTQMPLPSQVGGGAPMPGGLDLSGLANHLDAANSPLVSPAPESTASVGAKVSKSGFSTDSFNKVKKTQGPLDAAMAQDRADVEAEYTPLKNKLNAAEEASGKAEDLKAKAEADKAVAIAEGKGEIADAQYGYHNQVQAAYAHARAEAESSKADYRTALANYAAAQVDPGQLWDSKSTAGKFGLMATAFVHDFLGAKGIKTSAMDTINTAIERNIQSQVMAIKQKGEVAAGFKQLWDMQRAQSQSDAEAKDRMHGFYLKALDNEIDSRMGSFDSDLALAKGQAAKAENQKAQIKNDIAVQQHIDAATNARAKDRVSIYGHQLAASTARAEMTSREKIALAKTKGEKASAGPPVIYDLTNSGGGKAIRRIKPEYADDKELQRDVANKTVSTTKAVEGMNELIELQSRMSSLPDGLEKSRLNDELNRKEEGLRGEIVAALLYDATGKTSVGTERANIEAQVPAKTWFTNGSNVGIISQTLRRKLDETNNMLRQYTDPLSKDDPAYDTVTGDPGFGKGEHAQAELLERDDHGKPIAGPADKAVQAIERPDALKEANPGLQDELSSKDHLVLANESWRKFTTENPEWAKETGGRVETDPKTGNLGRISASSVNKDNPPAAFVGMEALASHYKTDKMAKDYLEMWAHLGESGAQQAPNGQDANTPENQELSAFAMWELTKLQEQDKPEDTKDWLPVVTPKSTNAR